MESQVAHAGPETRPHSADHAVPQRHVTPPDHSIAATSVPAGSNWQPLRPAIEQRPARRVVALGRRKTAGWLVCGGGLAVILSAFLPWVTVAGVVNVGIGAFALVIAALGGALAYLGGRILVERTSRKTTIFLWALAGLDLLIVIGLFASQSNINSSTGGWVQPGTGFYMALLGLIATLVGTIMVQTTLRPSAAVEDATERRSNV